jgi:heme/copper-type cytochrome/quinol oxidase subunit 4
MKHHFRLVAILAVCLIAYGALLVAFRWMNQPRDASVAAGLGLILALLFIVPLIVRTIWRNL